jgi:transcriptional regulator with XRE-family HTH domain
MAESESGASTESLGAKLKRLRVERGMAQDRLAIEAHIDQSGLSKFERGKDRSMGEIPLRRIAKVLKITLEELVAGTDFQG